MTLEQLPLIMLRALALTIIIECAAAWILGIRTKHDQTTVALVNLMTNPLVVSMGAAVRFFIGIPVMLPATLVMEAAVVAAEGAIYNKTLEAKKNPYVLSLICNMTSYLVGEILNRFVF